MKYVEIHTPTVRIFSSHDCFNIRHHNFSLEISLLPMIHSGEYYPDGSVIYTNTSLIPINLLAFPVFYIPSTALNFLIPVIKEARDGQL